MSNITAGLLSVAFAIYCLVFGLPPLWLMATVFAVAMIIAGLIGIGNRQQHRLDAAAKQHAELIEELRKLRGAEAPIEAPAITPRKVEARAPVSRRSTIFRETLAVVIFTALLTPVILYWLNRDNGRHEGEVERAPEMDAHGRLIQSRGPHSGSQQVVLPK